MHNLQIFNSEEFGDIRTVQLNNEIYFVGKDVATALIKKTISETNTVEMMHLMRNVSYWMPSSEPLCKDRTRQKYCGVRGKKNQAGQINKYNQHRINFNRK